MSWTDDRVAILKKLWGEGHTAAEIAKELGGVTRNAVIGKAHRLKLSGRVSPIQQNKKPANKSVEPKSEKRIVQVVPKVASPSAVKAPAPAAPPVEKKRDKLYALTDLGPRMCRWPIGDPREEEFGFCGDESHTGLPYCTEHAKAAYQAATRSRILQSETEKKPADDAAEEVGNMKKAAG